MSWLRLNLHIELGKADPEPAEMGGADSITEISHQPRPIGFYPPSDPTRRSED